MDKNLQNQTVSEHMAKASLAMRILQSLDLTVLNISGIGERPRIQIIPGAGCNQLKPGYRRRLVNADHRYIERVADVSGCLVTWEERT
ncbi:MAG: hypothetical protein AB7S90_15785 [Marinobacterium sp.]